MLHELQRKLTAQVAHIEMNFPYFMEKEAPRLELKRLWCGRVGQRRLRAAPRVTVFAGSPGDTLDASGVTGTVNHVIFVGGAGADKVTAGDYTKMTGGAGANEFIFDRASNNNVITDFSASSSNEIVLSNSGFDLGLSGATATPKALPSSLFVSNSAGTFTNGTQRFAYDTTNGELYFDPDGNGASSARNGVVGLTGHPTLSASQLFFVT